MNKLDSLTKEQINKIPAYLNTVVYPVGSWVYEDVDGRKQYYLDAETAEISVRAAITGHLVLSTLHTNDAVSAIVRLEDMGVEPYLVMIGDFVYYKGYWWQLIIQENNYGFGAEPDREQKWKKIDKNYDRFSAYTVNDVIYYPENGHYYKCLKHMDNLYQLKLF